MCIWIYKAIFSVFYFANVQILERAIDEFQSTIVGVAVVELEDDAALDGRIGGAFLQPSEFGVDGVVGAAVAAPEAAVGVLEATRPVHRPWLLQITLRKQQQNTSKIFLGFQVILYCSKRRRIETRLQSGGSAVACPCCSMTIWLLANPAAIHKIGL
jgi:uncharacterized membrane protein YobD (UPF0266 family)